MLMANYNSIPKGPYNALVNFIGPNPITSFNPVLKLPKIHATAFIGPFSSIIGDVTIGANVFVAPNVSVRADEGTPFFIGSNTNLQDNVILHGLKDESISVGSKSYSIYIGNRVTCAHDSLIHGPCFVGNRCFIGFKAIIFSAILEDDVYVSTDAIVINGVHISSRRFIPPGAIIDTQEKADRLQELPLDQEEFAHEVQKVNTEFAYSYSLLFGKKRCSCGLACDN